MTPARLSAMSLGLTLAVFASAYAQQQHGRYVSRHEGFSVLPPKGWTVNESHPTYAVVFRGPAEDKFAPFISVLVDPERVSLAEYMQMHKARCEREVKGFKVVADKRRGEDDEKGEGERRKGEDDRRPRQDDRATTLVVEYEDGGHPLRATQHIVRAGHGFFVITCAALKDKFETHQDEFRKCLESFHVEVAHPAGKGSKSKKR